MATDQLERLVARIDAIERSGRRRLRVMYGITAVALALAATALVAGDRADPATGTAILDEVRTRSLVVVDDRGRMRVQIAQDSPDIERYARSAGLTIYDKDGRERGGIATLDDGSAVVALDAPWGVGSPMRDRAGMKVSADGSALLGVLSNRGTFAAVLQSDGEAGRLELRRPDDARGTFELRTLAQSGDRAASEPMSPKQRKSADKM